MKIILQLCLSWLVGLAAFFAALHTILGSTVPLAFSTIEAAWNMWPYLVPAAIVFIPAIWGLQRIPKTSRRVYVLPVFALALALIPTAITLFVMSGSWVAFELGTPRWWTLIGRPFRTGLAFLFFVLYGTMALTFCAERAFTLRNRKHPVE